MLGVRRREVNEARYYSNYCTMIAALMNGCTLQM
jgi:hypothetical protein